MKAPKPRHTLSLEEARRIALAAQGFLPFERTSKRKNRRRWRMQRAREYRDIWRGIADYGRNNASEAQALLEEIRNRGALGISGFKGERPGSPWWGWKNAKTGLEWLFWIREVTTTKRRNFERIYDLTERVLPAEVLNTPTPPVEESQRHLLSIAAGALGVAAEADLRDYFRLTAADAKPRIAELTEGGELIPVKVEGWKTPAYLHRRRPPRIPGQPGRLARHPGNPNIGQRQSRPPPAQPHPNRRRHPRRPGLKEDTGNTPR